MTTKINSTWIEVAKTEEGTLVRTKNLGVKTLSERVEEAKKEAVKR